MLNLLVKNGAGNEDRTRDILLGKQGYTRSCCVLSSLISVIALCFGSGCGQMPDQARDQAAQQDQYKLQFINFMPGFEVQAMAEINKLGDRLGVRYLDILPGHSVTITGQIRAVDCGGTMATGCMRHSAGYDVVITYRYGIKADETALAHEMTHVYASIVEGDPDAHHVRRYLWDCLFCY